MPLLDFPLTVPTSPKRQRGARLRHWVKTMSLSRTLPLIPLALLGFLLLGCSDDLPQKNEGKTASKKDNENKKEIGKNVWLEKDGDKRRVLISTKVCRRTDMLEQLLTLTKTHEAILNGEFDARTIHMALVLAR